MFMIGVTPVVISPLLCMVSLIDFADSSSGSDKEGGNEKDNTEMNKMMMKKKDMMVMMMMMTTTTERVGRLVRGESCGLCCRTR